MNFIIFPLFDAFRSLIGPDLDPIMNNLRANREWAYEEKERAAAMKSSNVR